MAVTPPTAQQITGTQASLYTILTGVTEVDAILGMSKWGGALGTGAMLTYSFPTLASQFDRSDVYGAYGPETGNETTLTSPGLAGFNADQQAAAVLALAAFSQVANLRFDQVDPAGGGGTLRFNFSGALDEETAAFSNFPMQTADSGDTFFGANSVPEGFAPGTQNFLTLTHELGHALGLKHPHDSGMTGELVGWPENNTVLLFRGDDILTEHSTRDSVMAYNDLPGYGIDEASVEFAPTTLMRYDIQALQFLYGPNTAYNAGDTTYSFTTDQQINQTIWDGGGDDTISVSGPGASRISLVPGSWSEIGAPLHYQISQTINGEATASEPQTLFIYDTVIIENAVGGAGDDEITGNAANNRLTGNAGYDVFDGGAGIDVAVYGNPSGQARVEKVGGFWVVTDKSGANDGDFMINVEQLEFSDKSFELVNLPRTGAPTYGKTGTFLFDSVYYLLNNADLVPSQTLASAAEHYISTGAGQGKAPNSWFDPVYYADKWADLKALDLDAATLFLHYNLFGVWEGRAAGPKFDAFDGNRYLTENPDVAAYVDANVADFLNSRSNGAIAHFVIYGSNEQREVFDTAGPAIDFDYSVDLFNGQP